jgi:hypothetical protein
LFGVCLDAFVVDTPERILNTPALKFDFIPFDLLPPEEVEEGFFWSGYVDVNDSSGVRPLARLRLRSVPGATSR